jgi:hypothetical protein
VKISLPRDFSLFRRSRADLPCVIAASIAAVENASPAGDCGRRAWSMPVEDLLTAAQRG